MCVCVCVCVCVSVCVSVCVCCRRRDAQLEVVRLQSHPCRAALVKTLSSPGTQKAVEPNTGSVELWEAAAEVPVLQCADQLGHGAGLRL